MPWLGWSASRTSIASPLPMTRTRTDGIVTPTAGLMNPNHYLAVAIRYLLMHRSHWPAQARSTDAGEQQHDRPGGAPARPSAL